MSHEKCKQCGATFGLLESKTLLRKPVKPKGTPYRYVLHGYLCEDCEHLHSMHQNRLEADYERSISKVPTNADLSIPPAEFLS